MTKETPRRSTSPPIASAQLAGLREVAVELGPLLGDDLEARLLAEIDAAAAAYETGDVDQGRHLGRPRSSARWRPMSRASWV